MDSLYPGLIADTVPSHSGGVTGTFIGEAPPRMVARVTTVAFQGIDVRDVDVQVQMSSGLPAFMIVGLPDKAVAESKERVRGALATIGLALPQRHITVNLAPADVLKEGSHFDLPIALALLTAMGVLPGGAMQGYTALGELALDGAISPVAGVLAAASYARRPRAARRPEPRLAEATAAAPDLCDIKGQESAKRALEIAAAAGHNLLLIGPPGSGKSMLAQRLPGLLPPLEPIEALEVSMIHSVAGALEGGRLMRQRPFRDPHHTASVPALVGGGMRARPGEVSLAHDGVLFLGELPEFARPALEALRQPLETGRAVIARANAHVSYPARVQLVAAMNPCRCGWLDDAGLACSRAPRCAQDYQSRISGPLFDRIDLHVEVPAVNSADLALPPPAEVAARVARARRVQAERYAGLTVGARPLRVNADADGEVLENAASAGADGRSLLLEAAERMRLSARGYHRVARTIADLDGAPTVTRLHIAEALSYRRIAPGR